MRHGDWISTFTGVSFYPLDPRPEDVVPEDIAHALANVCRWGGHCTRFYSVAEHSLRVARVALWLYCDRAERDVSQEEVALVMMAGLLHDAHEAYLADLCRPVKRFAFFCVRTGPVGGFERPWHEVEGLLDRSIRARFALPATLPGEVQSVVSEADQAVLAMEAHEFCDERVLQRWGRYPHLPVTAIQDIGSQCPKDPRGELLEELRRFQPLLSRAAS